MNTSIQQKSQIHLKTFCILLIAFPTGHCQYKNTNIFQQKIREYYIVLEKVTLNGKLEHGRLNLF